jgi:hypothetical protein
MRDLLYVPVWKAGKSKDEVLNQLNFEHAVESKDRSMVKRFLLCYG